MKREIVFLNFFTLNDFSFFLFLNEKGRFSRTDWDFFYFEGVDSKPLIDFISETENNLVVINPVFFSWRKSDLEKLKEDLDVFLFESRVISFIKDQFNLFVDDRREKVFIEGFCFFDFDFESIKRKLKYNFSQLFVIKSIFGSEFSSVQSLYDSSRRRGGYIIYDFFDFDFSEYDDYSIISEDWYCFIYKFKCLFKNNPGLKNKFYRKMIFGEFSGSFFVFDFEMKRARIFKDFYEERNSKLKERFSVGVELYSRCSSNSISISDLVFSKKSYASEKGSDKIDVILSLIDKTDFSIQSKISDLSYDYYLGLESKVDSFYLNDLKPLKLEVEKHKKIFSNRGFSSLLIEKTMSYVISCRRSLIPDVSFYLLNDLVVNNIDSILSDFNVRYLVCIVDTYVEYGFESDRSDFSFISLFVANLKLIETLSAYCSDDKVRERIMTDATDPYAIVNGDALSNVIRRFIKNSKSHLAIKIFKEIIIRYSKSNNEITNKIFSNNNLKKIIINIEDL